MRPKSHHSELQRGILWILLPWLGASAAPAAVIGAAEPGELALNIDRFQQTESGLRFVYKRRVISVWRDGTAPVRRAVVS